MSEFDTVKKNLEGLGYTVKVFATAKEAGEYLDTQIDGTTVGIGGSGTVLESGAYELLSKHNKVYWHWKDEDQDAARHKAMDTEVYLASANALAETGEMVNIDGTGNRAASMLYGHERLYYLIGKNKLVPTLEDAIDRARNYAGPRRAKQMDRGTPCTIKLDRCHDCRSPKRICRGMNILLMPMTLTTAEVLLIDEELGI